MASVRAVPGPHDAAAWTVGFATDDVARAADEAIVAGGTVRESPAYAPGRSDRALAYDPWGVPFALFERTEGLGFAIAHRPGAYDWCDLFVPDATAARAFYARVLGATTRPVDDQDPAAVDGFLVVDGRPVAAIFERPDVVAHWLPFFEVADADTAVAACRTAGGGILTAPHDTPYGRLAHLVDPFGAPFAVNEVERGT